MMPKVIYLSQFEKNQGSGVGDYAYLLRESIMKITGIDGETRFWNSSVPNWPELLKPPPQKSILSIQFVPYSFGRWGFFLPFLRELIRVKDHWYIHLMFHEIWIGDYPDAPLKEKIIGRVQKWLILKMIREVKPIAIHTTNEAYMSRLSGICSAHFLPLFGNIPYQKLEIQNITKPELLKLSKSKTHNKSIILCFFGSIYENDQLIPRLEQVFEILKNSQREINILSIGSLRTGSEIWQQLSVKFKDQARFIELGKFSKDDVSYALQLSDFGITTTDLDIIGKSGATMAMLEHGLSVILTETKSSKKVLTNDHYLNQLIYPEQLNEVINNFIQSGIPNIKAPRSGLEDTARMFIEDLENGMAKNLNLSREETEKSQKLDNHD